MSKISLIIQREYLSRVKKKSFIIMTILGPVLLAGAFALIIYLMLASGSDVRVIKVLDEARLFEHRLPKSDLIVLEEDTITLDLAKKTFEAKKYYGILYLPDGILTNPNKALFYSEKQASIDVVSFLERSIQKEIETSKLIANNIDEKLLESIKTKVNLNTRKLTDSGEEKSNVGLTSGIGMAGGILIYLFIFIYGIQVMRGVIEEKTSRIVEVIMSSVKPFQLMMGKIIGIALVGLTQFLLWVILTVLISTALQGVFFKDLETKSELLDQKFNQAMPMGAPGMMQQPMYLPDNGESRNQDIKEFYDSLASINIPLLLFAFVFFFLGGYLLYSAMFAAIGAAVDNETDTQQFMFPVTIPLILAYIVGIAGINNPESNLAFWFSIIPFTSPIVMLVRLPFGVPAWELVVSMALLVVTFIFMTWLAGKIYRTGILLYGKKITWKEMGRWLLYRG